MSATATTHPLDKLSTFEAVNHHLRHAARRLELSDKEVHLITRPYRELKVELPVHLDNGEWAVFPGYRVQHNNVRGPFERAVCATTRRSTRTRSARWPPS